MLQAYATVSMLEARGLDYELIQYEKKLTLTGMIKSLPRLLNGVLLNDKYEAFLKKKGMTLTTAESCTGGLIAGRIVNVAGASDVFCEAAVTYSNQAKHRRLHVKKSTLKEYGAVSEETACEMAFGAADAAKADIAVAVTGIAGPDGGTPEKPVGLVYIACACGEEVTVERHVFNGNRAKVREQTVIRALDLVRRTAESAPVKKAPDKKK